MQHKPFRLDPAGPAIGYRSFTVGAPLSTHWRRASCDEVGCASYARGFLRRVNPSTDKGAAQAYYIRHDRSRAYSEERQPDGWIVFAFKPGTRCFTEHKVRIPRPEIYVARAGDWRGNPTGEVRRHVRSTDWIEDFALNQIKLKERLNRG